MSAIIGAVSHSSLEGEVSLDRIPVSHLPPVDFKKGVAASADGAMPIEARPAATRPVRNFRLTTPSERLSAAARATLPR